MYLFFLKCSRQKYLIPTLPCAVAMGYTHITSVVVASLSLHLQQIMHISLIPLICFCNVLHVVTRRKPNADFLWVFGWLVNLLSFTNHSVVSSSAGKELVIMPNTKVCREGVLSLCSELCSYPQWSQGSCGLTRPSWNLSISDMGEACMMCCYGSRSHLWSLLFNWKQTQDIMMAW